MPVQKLEPKKKSGEANIAALSLLLDKDPDELTKEEIGFACAWETSYTFLALEAARRCYREGDKKMAQRYLLEASMHAIIAGQFCGLEFLSDVGSSIREKADKPEDKLDVEKIIDEAYDEMFEQF